MHVVSFQGFAENKSILLFAISTTQRILEAGELTTLQHHTG